MSITKTSRTRWCYFGVLGYVVRVFGYFAPPLILGFVLGPNMEQHFRRALLLFDGSFMALIERPISATLAGLTGLMVAWALLNWLFSFQGAARQPAPDEP